MAGIDQYQIHRSLQKAKKSKRHSGAELASGYNRLKNNAPNYQDLNPLKCAPIDEGGKSDSDVKVYDIHKRKFRLEIDINTP